MPVKGKILWGLFGLILVLALVDIGGEVWNWENHRSGFWGFSLLLLPGVAVFFHSVWTLSFLKGLLLLFSGSLTGFIFERLGLKYGMIFGGRYVYNLQGAKFFEVPLAVVFYWAIFIYAGYCLTNSFLFWQQKRKPGRKQGNACLLPFLVLTDGLAVVAIDLFMDPLQVQAGSWAWLDKGVYFGVPAGNFFGWFLVVVISTGFFRTYEYFYPSSAGNELPTVPLIPVLAYGLLYLSFLVSALRSGMTKLALVGSLTMLPVVTASLFLFLRSKLIRD
ncbi:MAG: carotenoid biosynthesis protein [Candidatus Pacebacteria bacterium]|nr:carotenoid biosynthesis protein [Candidatus Paceibacterota bacterium]